MREPTTATEHRATATRIARDARVRQLDKMSLLTLGAIARLRGLLTGTSGWAHDELVSFILTAEGYDVAGDPNQVRA